MFSVVSVCQSVILPTGGHSHVTITHDALDITVHCPTPQHWIPSDLPPPTGTDI